MKKTVTLIELIIAIILLAVIILGAIAFDSASRRMFRSSEENAEILNDLTFALEHIHKNVIMGIGDITAGDDRRAVNVTEEDGVFILTIWQDTSTDARLVTTGSDADTQVTYVFNPTNSSVSIDGVVYEAHTINFEGDALLKNLMSIKVEERDGGVAIDNFTLRTDPESAVDRSTNPEVSIEEQFFFPLSQSLS